MKSLTDERPLCIDTNMLIKSCKWSPNGNVLAVAGSLLDAPENNKGVVQFYNPLGHHIRSLRVPTFTGLVNSVSWEGYGLRIALAVDTNILFANIQPEYLWGYFSNTLVFAFRKPERNDMCIIFWDTTVNQKQVKYMKRLKQIAACGDYCVLITKLEDTQQNEWMIVLCNAVGCPLEQKTINIEPRHVTMSQTHVIVANNDTVYYWQYRTKGKTIEQQKKAKSGKENAFLIDDTPKNETNYDKDSWTPSSSETTD